MKGKVLTLSLVLSGMQVLDARAECVVVGHNENDEPIVECDGSPQDNTVSADICDPRIVNDCYGTRNPNPRPDADESLRLPYRGEGVVGRPAGEPPRNAAGPAVQGAPGSAPMNAAGR